MDYLKRTIAEITQQLEVLTRSQKIAIALCAVVVAGSLVWLIQYSKAPEMTPVLAQDLTLTQIDSAMQALDADRIDAKQVGNRVFVRPADRDRALLALNRAEALPEDTSVGFAELMADSDPFRSSDENKWRRQVALNNELARIIASGDDVESARVITQEKSKRRLGAWGNIKPTASVHVKLARGKPISQPIVNGFCRFVSGAVPGLAPHDVTVIDATTSRAYSTPSPEDALGMGLLEERKKNEQHLTAKIMAALQSVPGVLVSVSVDLDATRTSTQTQAWDKPQVSTDMSSTQTNESAAAPGESGVSPNVGVALSASARGTRSETETSETEFHKPLLNKFEDVHRVPFTISRATASIGIPRSFITGIFRARFGDEPAAAELDDNDDFLRVRDEEISRVRGLAQTILMTDASEDVEVEMFYDFAPGGGELNVFPGADAVPAAAGMGVGGYARRYGMQTGLFALAMISFFMMARMVRQSSNLVREALPRPARSGEAVVSEDALNVSGGPIGRATVPEGLLEGQEIDDEALRVGQLGEQVSRMVETDPQTAADLIRRWAESDE